MSESNLAALSSDQSKAFAADQVQAWNTTQVAAMVAAYQVVLDELNSFVPWTARGWHFSLIIGRRRFWLNWTLERVLRNDRLWSVVAGAP